MTQGYILSKEEKDKLINNKHTLEGTEFTEAIYKIQKNADK